MNEGASKLEVTLAVALTGSVVVQVVSVPFGRRDVTSVKAVEELVVHEEVLMDAVDVVSSSPPAVTSELKAKAPSRRSVPISKMAVRWLVYSKECISECNE